MCTVARCRHGLRRELSGSALTRLPKSVSRGACFRGFPGSHLLRPVRLLAPLDGSDQVSLATGDFYIQASGGSVALPAAGYDYNSHWTPLLAGLSPAGMAASLAAPDLTGSPRPPGAFTSRLPTGWSPFPSPDMTTTATGLLCWRDFHPQEWQLASLHQITTELSNQIRGLMK